MGTDRTEALIVNLAAGLAPVPRLPSLSVRFMRWLAVALVTATAAVWFIGLRPDVLRAMATPAVLLSLGLAAAAFGSAAALALRLSIPGVDQPAWLLALPGAMVSVWTAALVVSARSGGMSWPALLHEPFHAACIVRTAAIAVVPTIVLVREVRRGFALSAGSAVALAALGGGALAAMAVQLVCPIDRPAHLLTSHVLPIFGLVMTAAAAARALRPS